ncbi:IS66 family transposase [Paludibaculum fermentans]|uniref:IS66 family transposase n=1 Tax=Paludibaculum fermentans TaxID=1473598 RepID=UPI003EB88204
MDLERSKMANSVGGARRVLALPVGVVRVGTGKLHGDGTPVLAPGDGMTKTARLWTFMRAERPAGDESAPVVWAAYSPDRTVDHPQQLLKGSGGPLQAVGYAGFSRRYEAGVILEAALILDD